MELKEDGINERVLREHETDWGTMTVTLKDLAVLCNAFETYLGMFQDSYDTHTEETLLAFAHDLGLYCDYNDENGWMVIPAKY